MKYLGLQNDHRAETSVLQVSISVVHNPPHNVHDNFLLFPHYSYGAHYVSSQLRTTKELYNLAAIKKNLICNFRIYCSTEKATNLTIQEQ